MCCSLKVFPRSISISRRSQRHSVQSVPLKGPVMARATRFKACWNFLSCVYVSAVPEPNTEQGTIQTDKIMDEKGVENLSCILVAFLIAIALAALDRKAYPAQRAGKSSPAPTVTLKPVANIQRWGPSQWGVGRWLRDPGQPCHSQNGAQLPLLPGAEYPGGVSPQNHSKPRVKINSQHPALRRAFYPSFTSRFVARSSDGPVVYFTSCKLF